MRKYLYLALAAASATIMVAPVVAQAAPAAATHVLTIKKTGGVAVKVGAKLTASLVKGTTATFTIGSVKLTCKSASFTAVVVKNPTAKGTATESLTSETMGKCTTSISGVTIKSIKALNLPYNSTVSDAKGLPVTVSGRSKTKPIELTAVTNLATCTYKASIVKGAASNKGNTITITKQPFTKVSCVIPGTALFSAKYGPVHDTSVAGSPAVFVN